MLRLLLGASGTGKTTWLLKKTRELSSEGKRVFFIVPEQYSFETEKAVGSFVASGGEKVEAVSFSRLANLIFREYGGLAGDTLADSGRTMLMSMVLDEVGEMLSVYNRQAQNVPFASKVLTMLDEFKNSALSPQMIKELSQNLEEGPTSAKLGDLALIYSTYEAFLERGRHDARDDLMRALELVRDTDFFCDCTVILDGFFSFPKAELMLIQCALQKAEDVYISLCCDGLSQSPARAFDVGRQTARRLMRLAHKNGCPAAAPVLLKHPYRFQKKALCHVAERIPYVATEESLENDGSLLVARASSRYEEVRFVAATIRRLCREEGLRYRDIVVIVRSLEDYQTNLEDVFGRYHISYFMDERIQVQYMPLMTFVTSLVDIARGNFTTQDIFRHLKTYLMELNPDNIYELEGYCTLWSIDHGAWTRPFQQNPAGMQTRMEDEDMEKLQRLEELRQRIIAPLESFRNQVKGNVDGETFARAIFHYLEETGVPQRIQLLAENFEKSGEKAKADELYACWDLLIGLLEQCGSVLGERTLGLTRLSELWNLSVSNSDLGHIPQTLDQVTIGSADRIRPSGPKVTIILGANEGSFPLNIPPQSLISQSERLTINRLGEQVLETLEDRFYKEFTYIYTAVTSPSHQLIITYPTQDSDGKPLFPAPFVQQVCRLVQGLHPVEIAAASPGILVENSASAMDILAEHLREDTSLTSSLIQVVSRDQEKAVQTLLSLAKNQPYHLEDESLAGELLGKKLRLSPSRLDRFYSCPFQYFCRDMLLLKPRQKVEFSPIHSGTLIHYVLEQMVSRHGARGLQKLTRSTLRKEVEELLSGYLKDIFGEEIPKRMQYLFLRLSDTLVRLLSQLAREFAQSAFEPADFELPINERSENRPVELISKTGERILVEGVVDRVDIATVRGRKYVRVVDYKSGVKRFSLSDIAYGLNMQMLIYLFSLWENGAGKYKDCYPAGVLYLPAKSEIINADRHTSDEQIEREHQKTMKMNGLILEDDSVVEAMESGVSGIFIPAKKKKDGSFDKASSLASLARFGKLRRYVDDQIIAMADHLRKGKIATRPVENGGILVCQYCDYQTVCKHEREDGQWSISPIDKEQFYQNLEDKYREEG